MQLYLYLSNAHRYKTSFYMCQHNTLYWKQRVTQVGVPYVINFPKIRYRHHKNNTEGIFHVANEGLI